MILSKIIKINFIKKLNKLTRVIIIIIYLYERCVLTML